MILPEKALSIRQPWAWLVVNGYKTFENRSKAALSHGMVTGPLTIHASKGMTQAEYEVVYKLCLEEKFNIILPRPDELFRGAIIGTVNVDSKHDKICPMNDWSYGSGLMLSGAQTVDPIPCNGALGYFKWKPSGGEIAEIKKWMNNWNDFSSDAEQPSPNEKDTYLDLWDR